MKFLVDENVGHSIIEHLRDKGFDVKSISELYPSRDDIFIIKLAQQENRIIITNDKDFGYLVFKTQIAIPVIYYSGSEMKLLRLKLTHWIS